MKKKVIKMCLGYDEGTNEYLLTINYFLIVSFENDNSSGRGEMNFIQVGKQCKGKISLFTMGQEDFILLKSILKSVIKNCDLLYYPWNTMSGKPFKKKKFNTKCIIQYIVMM